MSDSESPKSTEGVNITSTNIVMFMSGYVAPLRRKIKELETRVEELEKTTSK